MSVWVWRALLKTVAPPARAGRREWIGLGVIALPCLLYSMDLTVLNLAVPSLSADLKPSSTQLLWIIDIYGFLVAGSLITMGTLGDRIGRRRLLLIGAAAFGVASTLAAFSTSAGMLIATRAVLGLAGATLAPSTLSLIRNMFLDPRQRAVAIGVWIIGAAPPERAGAASAISETCSEFGGALGIAILGSIGTAIYRRAMAGPVVDGIPHEAGVAARDTLGGAVAAAGQFPGPGAALLDTARKAFAEGLQVTAMTSAVVVLGMAILVLVLLRHVRSGSELAAQPDRAPERTIADTAST